MIQPDPVTIALYQQAAEFRHRVKQEEWRSLLDLGCGWCLHAADFATTGRTVYAIDHKTNLGVTEFAKQNGVSFQCLAWEQLDCSQQFDAIYSHHILEHIQNPIGAIIAWSKMLPIGGIMAIAVPRNQADVIRHGHVSMGWSIVHLAFLMAIAGIDCSRGRFCKYASSVFGYGFKGGAPIGPPYMITDCEKFLPTAIHKDNPVTWVCRDTEVNWK